MFSNAKILALSSVSSIAIFMISSCIAVTSPVFPTPSVIPATNSALAELGNTKVSQKDNATLVYIPAGQFLMGSEFGLMDEKPVHIVQLDAFWLDPFDPNTRNYYAVSRFKNPMGVPFTSTGYRSLRGGSWNWTFGYERPAYRLWFGKDDHYDAVGLRCAVSE